MRLDAHIDRDLVLSFLGHRGQRLDGELDARLDDAIAACERELRPSGIYREFAIGRPRSSEENPRDLDECFSAGNSCVNANVAAPTFTTSAAPIASADSATSIAPTTPTTPATPAMSAIPVPFITLKGCDLVLSGHDIVRHLEGATTVVLMACTLGMECERFLRLGRARSVTEGLLRDAAASAYVEDAAETLNRLIADDARRRGLRAGTRFSPGYGDLPLAIQPAFVEALDAGKQLGLTVTEAHLLIPTKSITAVVGICGPQEGSRTV